MREGPEAYPPTHPAQESLSRRQYLQNLVQFLFDARPGRVSPGLWLNSLLPVHVEGGVGLAVRRQRHPIESTPAPVLLSFLDDIHPFDAFDDISVPYS